MATTATEDALHASGLSAFSFFAEAAATALILWEAVAAAMTVALGLSFSYCSVAEAAATTAYLTTTAADAVAAETNPHQTQNNLTNMF